MKTATLALAFVAASSIAHADTPSSEPSTTLPEITVYPHPGALLIDRLSPDHHRHRLTGALAAAAAAASPR